MNRKYLLLLAFLAICVNLFSQQFPDDLLFYYPIHNNANDITGHCYHGIPYGATLTEDRFGNLNSAYELDGVDDAIIFSNDSSLKLQFPISVTLWAYFDSYPGSYNWGIFTNDFYENYYTGIWISLGVSKELGIGFGNGNNINPGNRSSRKSSILIDTSRWVHIGAVFTNYDSLKIYLNGKDASGAYSGNSNIHNITYSKYPGFAGSKDFSFITGYMKGKLDEITYWNKSLSAHEVDSIYKGTITHADFLEKPDKAELIIYPNPACDYFTFKNKRNLEHAKTLKLFTPDGVIKKVYQIDQGHTNIFHINELPGGCYFCIVYYKNQLINSAKLIINR